jgi:hypothetical protein
MSNEGVAAGKDQTLMAVIGPANPVRRTSVLADFEDLGITIEITDMVTSNDQSIAFLSMHENLQVSSPSMRRFDTRDKGPKSRRTGSADTASEPSDTVGVDETDQIVDPGRSHGDACVGGAVVHPHSPFVISNPSGWKHHPGNISGPLVYGFWSQHPLIGTSQNPGGVLQIEQCDSRPIERAGGGGFDTVEQDQPAVFSRQRWRTNTDLLAIPLSRSAAFDQNLMIAPMPEIRAERDPDVCISASVGRHRPMQYCVAPVEGLGEEGGVLVFGR